MGPRARLKLLAIKHASNRVSPAFAPFLQLGRFSYVYGPWIHEVRLLGGLTAFEPERYDDPPHDRTALGSCVRFPAAGNCVVEHEKTELENRPLDTDVTHLVRACSMANYPLGPLPVIAAGDGSTAFVPAAGDAAFAPAPRLNILFSAPVTGNTVHVANHGVPHTLTISLNGNSAFVIAYAVANSATNFTPLSPLPHHRPLLAFLSSTSLIQPLRRR